MSRTVLAVSALAATALAAAGCGSSAKTEKTETTTAGNAATATAQTTPIKVATGTPLPRAQFILAADAICQRAKAQFAALGARSTAQLERALPQAAVYFASESESLSKLTAPSSMSHDWEQIVSDLHLTGEYTAAVAQHLKAKENAAATQFYAKAERTRKAADQLARRDGFKQCSARGRGQ